MLGHTQLFLRSWYSDIISLLTITVRGYQISIADCLFSLVSKIRNKKFCPIDICDEGAGLVAVNMKIAISEQVIR